LRITTARARASGGQADSRERAALNEKSDAAWPRFISNQALPKRHAITKGELKILKQVAMLETVAQPGHFIFSLNVIRQAAAQL